MSKQVNETRVVCPDCDRSLSDAVGKFEFCGVNDDETGFIYLCVCGKTFVVPFEKSA